MKYRTRRFGLLEVRDDEIIWIPEGLLGFTQLKRYTILESDEHYPFKWLQSLDEAALTFAIIDPTLFRPDYRVKISPSEVESLDIKNQKDVVVMVIVTLNADPALISANLQGPILFNTRNMKAKQIVLTDGEYETKHHILQERKKFAESKTA
ncbi:MAG: flagellar assembly protein FliW [Candidatus Tectomicrobia bacterium]|uniref:Flagellar assembly factor FliW n=1 Tax=Tectimicrobiota bacterium TaxID=2528274 RepID=A0A933GN46_UNCTE|nr:flagellar assembly protein FliW [Candidatus Tectomicrobia bacterium]